MHKKSVAAALCALAATGITVAAATASAAPASTPPSAPNPTLMLPSLPFLNRGTTPQAPAPQPSAPQTQTPTAPATTPAPAKVNGDQVDVIGDSITERANVAGSWNRSLPGVRVDGVVGRQFSAGIPTVTAMANATTLRPIVVLALGTNGPVSQADMDSALAAIGNRKVVLVNVGTSAENVTWRDQVNELIAKTQAAQPQRIVVADWAAKVRSVNGLLDLDGIHPSVPTGITAWTDTVVEAVNATAALTNSTR